VDETDDRADVRENDGRAVAGGGASREAFGRFAVEGEDELVGPGQ